MNKVRARKKTSTRKTGATEKKVTDIQYVLPLGNGWVVKAAKSSTFTAITDSRTEAIIIARALARTKHTQLVVHGKNGAVVRKESYVV